MKRKAWLIPLLLLLSFNAGISATDNSVLQPQYRVQIPGTHAEKLINPIDDMEPYRVGEAMPEGIPNRDPAVGNEILIGRTWYDYQHNGSISKMVVNDGIGAVHFVWMCGFNSQNDPRRMVYNVWDLNDEALQRDPEDRLVIDAGTRSGYGMLDCLPEDGRAVPMYHVLGHIQEDMEYVQTCMSVDWGYRWGAFLPFYPESWPEINLIWPHGALDMQNRAHILSTEYTEDNDVQIWQRVGYWRGDPNQAFDEWEWTNPPINVDTAGVISAVVATSVQSNKVALAWHHNRVGSEMETEIGDWNEAKGAWQRNNDVQYLLSEDGDEWDWENRQSITKILPTRPEFFNDDRTESWGDTFRAYCDIDIQFDPWEGEDNLYAAFAASGFWEWAVRQDDNIPVSGVTGEHGHLWFWNSIEDTLTLIYDGWYFSRTDNGGAWKNRVGAWRMNADRPSIAFNPDDPGTIYVMWVNFPKIMHVVGEGEDAHYEYLDNGLAQDTSEAGYKNAEIMVSISTDRGITWREPVNITETIWEEDEAPEPGECQSEAYASCAYLVDDMLHIMYVRDTDAGGLPQEEGSATNNPVIYHQVPLEELELNEPIEMPREGFMFHNHLDLRPVIPIDRVSRNVGVPLVNSPVEVSAEVTGGGNHELESVTLEYAIGDDVFEVDMADAGDNIFTGEIPGFEDGTMVWYRIRAVNDVDLETIVPTGWWWAYTARPEGGLRISDIQYRPEDWAVDYSPYNGYEVTVTGIVSTPPTFNQVYGAVAIQDDEAGWSGVFVRGIEQDLQAGTELTVTGMVMEQDPDDPVRWEFETYIDASSIEVGNVGNPPEPIDVNIDDLRYATRAEELEGVLVRTVFVEVDTIAPGDARYIPITDEARAEGWFTTLGLTPEVIEELGIADYRQGTSIDELTGVFAENFGKYAIALRSSADIVNVGVDEDASKVPYRFYLGSAYPNPFNAVTKIEFELARDGWTHLAVYDLTGRSVATLVQGEMKAGHYNYSVDAVALASGVYLLQLQTERQTATQKLVLVK